MKYVTFCPSTISPIDFPSLRESRIPREPLLIQYTSHSVEVIESSTISVESCISQKYKSNRSYTRKIWQYKHTDTKKLNLFTQNSDLGSLIIDAENIDSTTITFLQNS